MKAKQQLSIHEKKALKNLRRIARQKGKPLVQDDGEWSPGHPYVGPITK